MISTAVIARVAHVPPGSDRQLGAAAIRDHDLLTQRLFVHDDSHRTLTMVWAGADALRPDGSLDPAAWSAAR